MIVYAPRGRRAAVGLGRPPPLLVTARSWGRTSSLQALNFCEEKKHLIQLFNVVIRITPPSVHKHSTAVAHAGRSGIPPIPDEYSTVPR